MPKYLYAMIKKEDLKKLKEFLSSEKDYLKKRAQLLLLSGIHKYKVPEISKIIKIHPNHLRKWIHRYNKFGLSVVLEAPEKGKKRKFTENIKNKIIKIAKVSPRKFGLLFSNWTLYNLKKYLEEIGVVDKISHETIRKILKESNINQKNIIYDET